MRELHHTGDDISTAERVVQWYAQRWDVKLEGIIKRNLRNWGKRYEKLNGVSMEDKQFTWAAPLHSQPELRRIVDGLLAAEALQRRCQIVRDREPLPCETDFHCSLAEFESHH